MTPDELEDELEFAESLQLTNATWRTAASELRRVVKPKSNTTLWQHHQSAQILALPPAELAGLIAALAAALRQVPDGRHGCYLALAGALVHRGIDPAVLPSLIASVARAAGDPKSDRRVADAMSSVRAFQRGTSITGYSTLKASWPVVASAIDAHLPRRPTGTKSGVELQLSSSSHTPPLSLGCAIDVLEESIRSAIENPGTPVAVAVPPGVGKTRQAVEFALTHDTKVSIAHPSNAVALAHHRLAENLAPGDTRRRFGVLALIDETGSPVCKKYKLAAILQNGHLPVPQRLCIRCHHRKDCRASLGSEGEASARLALMNHAMLDAAIEHVGTSGLMILDESPQPFIHATISLRDFITTERMLRSHVFPAGFGRPCIPLLRLLIAESRVAADHDQMGTRFGQVADELCGDESFGRDILFASASFGAFDQDELDSFDQPQRVSPPPITGNLVKDSLAHFREALRQWPKHAVPPIRCCASRELMTRPGTGTPSDISVASRTVAALGIALDSTRLASAYWTVKSDAEEALHITYANPSLLAALGRKGPTVLLDATVDRLALNALTKNSIRTTECRVVDSAPVSRTLIAHPRGAKIHLAPKGRVAWPVFGSMLALALDCIDLSSAKNILLIGHKSCIESLRAALDSVIPHKRLQGLIESHRQSGGRTVLGHYGNLRGHNDFSGVSWSDLNAIVTIGDPWPDLGAVRAENHLLQLSTEQASERTRWLVAAELAQAHGRLRAPRQTKPTTAIHVGAVVPVGWDNKNTTVIQPLEGRPPNQAAMSQSELKVFIGLSGSIRALARQVGVSETTIRRYLRGRAIPADFAARVKEKYGSVSASTEQAVLPPTAAEEF